MKSPWTYRQAEKVVDWSKTRRIPDMHSHSKWCNHATNELKDIARHSLEKKIWAALNEHLPMPVAFVSSARKGSAIFDLSEMDEEYRQKFINNNAILPNQIESFAENVDGLKLPIGIEVGLFYGFENENDEMLQTVESALREQGVVLNHVSAAIHSLDGFDLFRPEAVKAYIAAKSAEHLIRRYFDTLGLAADSGKYDFICHPGMIHLFYNHATQESMMNNRSLREVYEKGFELLLETAQEKGVAIEINTSGIDRPASKFKAKEQKEEYCTECIHPHMPLFIMREAIRRGVMLVAGSDWHHPGEEQRYFDQLHDALLKYGAKQIYKIVDRKPVAVNLR